MSEERLPEEIEKALDAFDCAASTLAGQIWLAPGDGDETNRTRAELFNSIRRHLLAAYDDGFAASGEGWNGECPDGAADEESYRKTRGEWYEEFTRTEVTKEDE